MNPADAVPPTDDAASLSPEDVRRTLHELRVREIELEQQNEELRRTHAELNVSRARYFDLYDVAPVGYVTISEQGLILEANLTAATLLGVTRTDLVKQPLSRFVFKDDGNVYYLHRNQLFKSGEPQAYDVRMVKEDGTVFWAHMDVTASQDAAGEPVCRITLSDITERKRAEAALSRATERLALAQRSAGAGMWDWDIPAGELNWSPELYRLFGLGTEASATFDVWRAAVHPDDRTDAEARIGEAVHKHQRLSSDYRVVWPTGEVRWIHALGDTIYDESGEATRMAGICLDITERKREEESLRTSRAEFRGYFEMGTIGMCVTSPEKGWVAANDRLCQMLGYSKEELLQLTWAELTHPDDLQADVELFEQVMAGSRDRYELDKRFIRKDGSCVATTLGVACHRNSDGSLNHFLASLLDITERKRAEEALHASEAKHAAMVANISDVIGIIGVDGFMKYKSPNIEKHFGWKPSDLVGTDGWLTVHPDDLTRMQQEFSALLEADDASRTVEYRYKCKDGSYKPIELTATNLTKDPHVCGVLLNYRDITERKRAEEETSRTLSLLESTMESTADGILVADGHGRMVRFNTQFTRMWGIPKSIVDSKNDEAALNFVLGQLREPESFLKTVRDLYGASEDLSFDVLEFTDGRVFERYSRPQRIGEDVVGRVWSFRDVTERRRAEEALRTNEEHLRLAVEAAQLEWFDLDVASGKVLTSPGYGRILGYEPGEVTISQQMWIDGMHPDDSDGVLAVFRECLQTGDERAMEYRRRTKSGAWTWIRSTGKCSGFDADGNPARLSGTHMDISARKREEEAKAKLEGQLQQAQKLESIGRLAGGVAHDFNNMLGVILGHAEMAMEQVDAAQPLHTDLEEIRNAAKRSADLTRQLLAFARKQTVSPRVMDLNETVAGTLKMLRRLIGEDIHLTWEPGANLWPVKIDPAQMEQILTNLCVNARDAIAGIGTITVATANTVDDADWTDVADAVTGEYVRVTVCDTGCGMSDETRSHLFEPFFTTKEFGQGAGLGLSSVLGAVEQNGGVIQVRSELGAGTTFRIYLPRHVGHGEQAQASGVAGLAMRGHETILLVEDEPAILTLTTRMLERQGYTVLAASTPGDAIRMATEHAGHVHLLMTDVVMPEMNGGDLSKQLQSIHSHLKRLFMSGYTADVIADHGVVDERVSFIQKPFSIKDLAAKVREALDRE